MTRADNSQPGTIVGWQVLVGVLVFFGVIFAVNGVFLVVALDTHSGLVSQQPYRKGLDYNRRIAADEKQRRRGWHHRLELDGKAGKLRLALKDRHQRAVSGLTLTGFIGRPSTVRHDRSIVLSETPSTGGYTAHLGSLSNGSWLIQLQASELTPEGSQIVYRLKERIWLNH